MNNISVKSLYEWYRNTLRNPKYRWVIILGTIAYLISPFNLANEFIPILGQLDDVAILGLFLAEVSQMVLDFAKRRKGDLATTTTPDGQPAKTVEVDAVSVE
ncbi:DUF1232 domain-containing protein [Oscillatoria sp. FACHB-1406]|uniref:YkvA family protein n=1 Tax=Oscillatoria sp. FACHB-1406 TaxID=2692846 RepID=UPI001689D290|nr:DUF1232 domain-containing protein [Oscillatoria sp. FACHB-1406]MBD2579963.1 DUF1232 domain-containing protein [Oscillatoria sp. FACHB-1406]